MKMNPFVFCAVVLLFFSKLAIAQVWNGNLLFTNQADIDNFGFFNYTAVNGNLEIIDGADNQHNITNLAGLAGLTSVSGSVVIMNNNLLPNTAYLNLSSVGSLHISGNPALTTINGLPVTNAPSAIRIVSNNALTSITSFSAVTMMGDLVIKDNPVLSAINGFANIIKVTDSLALINSSVTNLNTFSHVTEAGSLVIYSNNLITTLNGLSALVKVTWLDIGYNAALVNLNGLTSLTSALYVIIFQNPALLSITGIDNLSFPNFGGIYIHNNNVLQNIVGAAGLVRLSTLSIQQNPALTSISGFNALEEISYLDIIGNPALTSISGFTQVDTVSGTLRFQQNANLTTINAFQNVRYIAVDYTNNNNYVLSSIAPMPLLDSISGRFQLRSDTVLTNLNFVPNLRLIGRDVLITSCKSLTNVNGLSNLTSIRAGFLLIDSCPQLTSLSGLAGLTRITHDLVISRTGVAGLHGLHNITRVHSTFRIENNSQLTSLNELMSLDTVSGNLGIRLNPVLTNLNGLRHMLSVQSITVGANAALSQFCGLYPLLAGNNPPTVVIGLNLVNPTVQEILAAGPCTSVQLPVTLKLFTVRCNGNKIMAHWVTANEFNSSHFVLQRSTDGVTWTEIGSIQAAGNSGGEQEYNLNDDVPLLNGLYRLAQYDIDASVRYSPVIKGGCAGQEKFTVWPNPATDKVIVTIQYPMASVGMVRMIDSKGVVVRSGSVSLNTGSNKFELSVKDLPAGIYTLQVRTADGVLSNAMIIKR